MTSWLTYILFAAILLSVISGWRKGLLRTLADMVSWILVLLLAGWINPYVSKFLKNSTSIDNDLTASCAAFLLAAVLAAIVVRIVVHVLDLVANLPVVGFFNHLGGAAFGVLRGVLGMWLFFILITIFSEMGWGAACMKEIGKDSFLQWLYGHNYLMNGILKLIA